MTIDSRALISVYLRNDATIDGAEMASLIRQTPPESADAATSARVAEFADPLDRQVGRIARGEIPGAANLFTPADLRALQQRVELANDDRYRRDFAAKIDLATGVPERAGNALDLHVDGAAYAELRQLIDSATETLDLEFFSMNRDTTSRDFCEALKAAVRRGVRVNFLLDPLMSVAVTDMLDDLRAAGVNVQTFKGGYTNPYRHLPSLIDHRKLVLADGRVGMVGGMNIGENYEKFWHDSMTAVRGPVLKDLYREFATSWTASGGRFPTDSVALAEARAQPEGRMDVAMHTTSPTERQIKQAIFTAIDQAKSHIYMNSPYFYDKTICDHLSAAARRGVRVVVSMPSSTDFPTTDALNRSHINDMLAAGVQVRLYDVTNPDYDESDFFHIHLSHAKLLTIDGVWTAVGTANADRLSMERNHEMNLAVSSASFARQVERAFFHTDAVSGRLSPAAAHDFGPWATIIRAALEKLAPIL